MGEFGIQGSSGETVGVASAELSTCVGIPSSIEVVYCSPGPRVAGGGGAQGMGSSDLHADTATTLRARGSRWWVGSLRITENVFQKLGDRRLSSGA